MSSSVGSADGVGSIASGLGFTEGPAWTAAGRLRVCSVSRGLIYELDGAGGARAVSEPGGNPTGMAQATDGSLWVAQGGGHARTSSQRPARPGIQRVRDDAVDDIVTTGADAPNDCAFAPDGRLWFTDPCGEPLAATGAPGRVCVLDPATANVVVAADDLRYPNGIAFDPRRGVLYVAETGHARVRCFRVDGDRLIDDAPMFELPVGHPDGLAIDRDGFVLAAAVDAGAVVAFSPDGTVDDIIELEAGCWATNLCFGGEGLATLFVTAARGGRVLAVESKYAG